MEWIQVVGLAVLQGLTEFLPVSSSAHLILLPALAGWPDQGLAFDVAVHVGTLLAVVVYFRKELQKMLVDWFGSCIGKGVTEEAKLAWYVGIGTIPVGIVGLMLSDTVETTLRSPVVIAAATIFFGLFLWIADRQGKMARTEYQLNLKDALIVGCFQMLALIPGTSRSGITIAGALLLGLTREAAARFSFLLSVPVIFLAGSVKTIDLMRGEDQVLWGDLAGGVLLSALSAYLCIDLFLRFVNKVGMLPFVIYRLILGVGLFVVFGYQLS